MSHPPAPEPFPFRKAAFAIAGALVGGYLLVAGMMYHDKTERAQLETIREETAAGALPVLPENWPPDPTRPVLTRDGKPFYIRRPGPDLKHEPDWKLIRSGSDDAGRIPLYRYLSKSGLGERYYFKVEPGAFYELSPVPGKPEPSPTPEPTQP